MTDWTVSVPQRARASLPARYRQLTRGERLALLALLILLPIVALYNLPYGPRTWHDEGAALNVAKTLATEGVYAMRNSDGYQTFGPIQSVGPTVLLPVAASLKLFGMGLLQARLVSAAYLCLLLAVATLLAWRLFGLRAAIVTTFLLLAVQDVRLLFFGRQVLGEAPALMFFLAGVCLFTLRARGRLLVAVAAGLLIGAAMVTKSTYIVIGVVTLAVVGGLDWLYYRQHNRRGLVVAMLVATACVLAWMGTQYAYFGPDTFWDNSRKMQQLATGTTGFNPRVMAASLQFFMGSGSGHFLYLWGLPALLYGAFLARRRDQSGFMAALLLTFTILWLGYYFWSVPWIAYLFAPAAIAAFFVAKLWHDLTHGFTLSGTGLRQEWSQGRPGPAARNLALLALFSIVILWSLQGRLRNEVLARDLAPQELAAILNRTVQPDQVIETWERELAFLTNHQYHSPDQALLSKTHAAMYRGGTKNYSLGSDSLLEGQPPAYLILGWYSRWLDAYDPSFIAEHTIPVASVGTGDTRYELLKIVAER